ncbi:MAG: hypothetical protein K0U23_04305 [Gammaproteobacteria bacterium]|nr:hypothetical protein [Gammaproteobacteria bacterium]
MRRWRARAQEYLESRQREEKPASVDANDSPPPTPKPPVKPNPTYNAKRMQEAGEVLAANARKILQRALTKIAPAKTAAALPPATKKMTRVAAAIPAATPEIEATKTLIYHFNKLPSAITLYTIDGPEALEQFTDLLNQECARYIRAALTQIKKENNALSAQQHMDALLNYIHCQLKIFNTGKDNNPLRCAIVASLTYSQESPNKIKLLTKGMGKILVGVATPVQDDHPNDEKYKYRTVHPAITKCKANSNRSKIFESDFLTGTEGTIIDSELRQMTISPDDHIVYLAGSTIDALACYDTRHFKEGSIRRQQIDSRREDIDHKRYPYTKAAEYDAILPPSPPDSPDSASSSALHAAAQPADVRTALEHLDEGTVNAAAVAPSLPTPPPEHEEQIAGAAPGIETTANALASTMAASVVIEAARQAKIKADAKLRAARIAAAKQRKIQMEAAEKIKAIKAIIDCYNKSGNVDLSDLELHSRKDILIDEIFRLKKTAEKERPPLKKTYASWGLGELVCMVSELTENPPAARARALAPYNPEAIRTNPFTTTVFDPTKPLTAKLVIEGLLRNVSQRDSINTKKGLIKGSLLENASKSPKDSRLKQEYAKNLSLEELITLFDSINGAFTNQESKLKCLFQEADSSSLFFRRKRTRTSWAILHAIKEAIITRCLEAARFNDEDGDGLRVDWKQNTVDGIAVDKIVAVIDTQLGRFHSWGETASHQKLSNALADIDGNREFSKLKLFFPLDALRKRKEYLYSNYDNYDGHLGSMDLPSAFIPFGPHY